MLIYKITNKINNKVYIGQTVRSLDERLGEHIRTKKSLVSKAFVKYGIENFIIEQIDHAHSIDELNAKEVHWIEFYNCITPNGYNQCEGGGNTKGFHHKESSKQKMSVSHKGKKCGVENSFYGKTHSDSIKKKFSLQRKGLAHLTAEQIIKLKNSHYKRKVMNVELNMTFDSVKEAAKCFNLKDTHITRACRNKQRTVGGYHWNYVV